MKKIVLVVCILIAAFSHLEAQEVRFQNLPFSEVLELAKEQNKMIFVDCYTSWCGPCRFMTDSIFTTKRCGDYFNEHFISVKYDMEKPEADGFKERYTASSFPTFYFLSPQGEVIHRMVGASQTVEAWLERVDAAVQEGWQLDHLRQNFRKEANQHNLKAYLNGLIKIRFSEGISDLFVELFKRSADKINFLYDHKEIIVRYLSERQMKTFLQAIASCDGYLPEMNLVFEGVPL